MEHQDLKTTVETFLKQDKNLRGYGLRVRTDGNTVYLTGTLDTLSEKKYLTEAVSSLPGVGRVVADIAISTDGAVTDPEIRAEVAEELLAAGVDLKKIGATVKNGAVILIGRTGNLSELERAQQAAAKARGVKDVATAVRLVNEEEGNLKQIFHSQVRNDREKGTETNVT